MPRRGVQGAHSAGWARAGQIGIDWGGQIAVQMRLGWGHPIRGLSMQNRWLLVGEICEYLGLCRDTVSAWLSAKEMPGHKLAWLWRFKREEADGWVRGDGEARKEAKAS